MFYDDRPWTRCYDPGIDPDMDIPSGTVCDLLDRTFRRFADRPAYHFLGVTGTYASLEADANRFAAFLVDGGCRRGDVVCINLPNIPQFLIALAGSVKAGCVVSGLSPLLSDREMAFQLNDSGAKALVTLDAIFEKRFLGITGDVPRLEVVASAGIADFLPPHKRFLARLLKKVPTGRISPVQGVKVRRFGDILSSYPDDAPQAKVMPEDPCLVQYTGGTTGLPKGAVLTHGNQVANLTQIIAWTHPEPGREVLLSGFPFFHQAGLILGMVSVTLGGAQVLVPNPRDTDHIVREMDRYRPTILVNVPSLYMMLMDNPSFRDLDFSNLKFCITGAAPFPVDYLKALEGVIGEGKMIEVYGMTETSPIITMNPRKGPKKLGTVGLPIMNTRLKLVDLDNGKRAVPVGEEGEIIVRGPQVMRGYLNRPEETKFIFREIDGERWLYTGDIGRMDREGYITIVDRVKDMIIVGGYKVYSREVEEKLGEHPAVEFCAIVGIPDPRRPGSELVKLVVQLAAGFGDREPAGVEEDLLTFARSRLSRYKVPRVIEFIEEMPLTAVGKVDKKALR